jgi:hypothetical protein
MSQIPTVKMRKGEKVARVNECDQDRFVADGWERVDVPAEAPAIDPPEWEPEPEPEKFAGEDPLGIEPSKPRRGRQRK